MSTVLCERGHTRTLFSVSKHFNKQKCTKPYFLWWYFSENLDKQVTITKIFSQILEQRENLTNEKRQDTSLPVGPTGPSTCDQPINDHLGQSFNLSRISRIYPCKLRKLFVWFLIFSPFYIKLRLDSWLLLQFMYITHFFTVLLVFLSKCTHLFA